jgi:predicted dehydrogenase
MTIDVDEPRQVRIGVVGCGYWGSKHLRVLSSIPGVAVAAIDTNEHALRTAQTIAPQIRTFRTMNEAMDEVDAFVIATLPSTHADLGLRAMAAGTDVLVEKPLSTSVADARALVDMADRTGRVLMVGHTFEYNPAVQYLRESLRSGALGDLYYIDSARLNLGLYQSDVNVVWDLAVHDVSIGNYLLERQPVEVSAWGLRHVHRALEDVAYIRLSYADPDVQLLAHVSWLDPAKVRRVTMVGSRRMAVYDDLQTDERVRLYDKGIDLSSTYGRLDAPPMTYRYGDIVSPHIEFREPLLIEDSHFIDCVRRRTRPLTDGRSGLAVVATLEAANLALRSGGSVAVEDVTRGLARVHA